MHNAKFGVFSHLLFIYKNRVYKNVPRVESVSYVHNTFVPKIFRYVKYLAV